MSFEEILFLLVFYMLLHIRTKQKNTVEDGIGMVRYLSYHGTVDGLLCIAEITPPPPHIYI
jgi:hypothetical protein